MSKKTEHKPCYEIDSNGKLKILPMAIPKALLDPNKKSAKKPTSGTKRESTLPPLKRLILRPADFEEPLERPSKVRKLDKTVRKELFKVPKIQKKKIDIIITPPTLPKSSKRKKELGTPISDFLEMEKLCFDKENDIPIIAEKSPNLSTLCVPLDNYTNLNSESTTKEKSVKTYLGEIKTIFHQSKLAFEDFSKLHKKRMQEIEDCFNKIDAIMSDNHPLEEMQKNQNGIRPSQSYNLRKSTLNKNFTRNLQYEQSPRTQNGFKMYNSIRSNINILCTPKVSGECLDSPTNNITRNLSQLIQKQCMMLQDTPSVKK